VVFYVSVAGVPKPPESKAMSMAVRFEKIGSIDDDGETAVIARHLRATIKGHSGCTIAVSGHTDTLGGDQANYKLSEDRAQAIADKLKTIFGDSLPVSRVDWWGERRLTQWTPDDTANEANRRVDIKVSCGK
jgi:outer membrane protein OmpA-like peptidoglycan-associated protein